MLPRLNQVERVGRDGGSETGCKLESLSETNLTEMARAGDRQAFGELVRRSRAQMYHWARSLTQDHHLAEDVVQEALVQAFLHVGRLLEQSRFTPWLARIVHNQAYMKLRRGGPYGKEQPFTGLSAGSGRDRRAETTGWSVDAGDGWRDIDRVLFQLSRHYDMQSRHVHDPAAAILRKELIDGIRQLFACLSAREKDIFEAHFFRNVTPQEIALVLIRRLRTYTTAYPAPAPSCNGNGSAFNSCRGDSET